MLNQKRGLKTWLTVGMTLLLAACSDDSTVEPPAPPPPGTAYYVAAGWAAFESGDLAAAADQFEQARILDDTLGEAHTGLGWCALRRATSAADLTAAAARFDAALARDGADLDAMAGRAAARMGTGDAADRAAADADAAAVLAADAAYRFSHAPRFDLVALRVMRSQAATAGGDFVGALGQLDAIYRSGIDGADAATWVVGGHVLATFEAAVIAQLDQVESLWRAGRFAVE